MTQLSPRIKSTISVMHGYSAYWMLLKLFLTSIPFLSRTFAKSRATETVRLQSLAGVYGLQTPERSIQCRPIIQLFTETEGSELYLIRYTFSLECSITFLPLSFRRRVLLTTLGFQTKFNTYIKCTVFSNSLSYMICKQSHVISHRQLHL